MARLPRLCPPGIPQHIIQRGNNRQICFVTDEDSAAYFFWLRHYAEKYQVDVHAWVLMTNHVHLLVTPHEEQAVSKMMQALGRSYVRYFNKTYQRTGTLWEGRFKSCLVQTASYVLYCYRYIELNPVRAGMVKDPSEYHWSSYASNALGRESSLLVPHDEYEKLGSSKTQRLMNYRSLFEGHTDEALINDLRQNTNKGLVFGSERFKAEMAVNLQRRLVPAKPGRRPAKMLL